ncbi:MAG: nucleotide sugar dehydrogenase [Deferribacteres bacterium]|nr:nucleotide sugar dehydrogenase [candidate division KSB1 bacterium]MCB9509849.1 nucleotide sugar dehydrogenase [Deferribacteres bacterium]
MSLQEKITDKSAVVGVIGLGYVGLPLSVEYAKAGFHVIGIDNDPRKITKLRAGENYIDDVNGEELASLIKAGKIESETDYKRVSEMDVIFICVPTPFTANKEPDVTYIEHAGDGIASGLRKEQIIILKSTTYPETTEKLLQPKLEANGMKVGEDFYLAFSPERIDPGNKQWTTANTPVVVGGVTQKCTDLAVSVSAQVIAKVVPLSSPKAAEMTKLLENIFRSVNIALVNEIAQLCDRMDGIDVWEVVQAAATKPFGFMPFYPGPGIGGHCILVDPYYLSWKAKEYDFHCDFIELAGKTNENMPYYVLDLIIRSLSMQGSAISKAKLLMLGVAFKKNVDDIRNSPAIKVMELLLARSGTNLAYNDPHVPELEVNGNTYKSRELTAELLEEADCVIITSDHDKYDFEFIAKHAKMIVDTRNATKNLSPELMKKVTRLGFGTNSYTPSPQKH